MDQDQPDRHMQEPEAEKTADLESPADALAAFRQLHRDLDQWERVHLARGLAAVLAGCYGAWRNRSGARADAGHRKKSEREAAG